MEELHHLTQSVALAVVVPSEGKHFVYRISVELSRLAVVVPSEGKHFVYRISVELSRIAVVVPSEGKHFVYRISVGLSRLYKLYSTRTYFQCVTLITNNYQN